MHLLSFRKLCVTCIYLDFGLALQVGISLCTDVAHEKKIADLLDLSLSLQSLTPQIVFSISNSTLPSVCCSYIGVRVGLGLV